MCEIGRGIKTTCSIGGVLSSLFGRPADVISVVTEYLAG